MISSDTDITSLPSNINITAIIQCKYYFKVYSVTSVDESQSLTMLKFDTDATSLPSGKNTITVTDFKCLSELAILG